MGVERLAVARGWTVEVGTGFARQTGKARRCIQSCGVMTHAWRVQCCAVLDICGGWRCRGYHTVFRVPFRDLTLVVRVRGFLLLCD